MQTDPEELFDVVNEQDQVIEQRQRADVHRQKLRHRAVHIFVRRPNGHLLIHQRTLSKEEFPGVWTSSASGHVSAGESYEQAAVRELTEELGISAPLQFCQKFSACPDTSMEFTKLYECSWDGDIVADPEEIQAVKWMPPDDVAQLLEQNPADFSPAFQLLFAWYQTRPKTD